MIHRNVWVFLMCWLLQLLAAPVAAAPAVGGTSDAGGAAPAAAAGEKKEKKTANVKLVKYDAKDKIKVGVG